MKAVVDICHVLLRPGGHLIFFCSAVKFETWARLFGENKVQGSTKKKRKKAFIVDTHDVVFLNKPGVYNGQGHRRNPSLINVHQKALNVTRRGANMKEMSKEQDKKTLEKFPRGSKPGAT